MIVRTLVAAAVAAATLAPAPAALASCHVTCPGAIGHVHLPPCAFHPICDELPWIE